jgi:putative ABC transport system permease protein
MDALADFRVAVRSLLRSKGFAIGSALTLALGIGATTTIFSVVYGVMLRPLPYASSSRLVLIQGEKDFSTGPRIMNFSAPEFEDFAGATRAFSSIAMSNTLGFTLKTDEGVELVNGATVSGGFFATLGAVPRIGRLIGHDAEPLVVISHRLWQRRFGGASDILGRTMRLADRDNIERVYTVAGVLPPDFQVPNPRVDVWRSLTFVRAMGDGQVANRNTGGYAFVARLKDGVSVSDATADANRAIDAVLKAHFNGGRSDMHALVMTLSDYARGTVGPALWILFGSVGLVLLVACANVANLILARQSSRAREISMRMALGAPRGRLLAYLLTESGLVAITGGAIGVAFAFGCIRVLQWLQPSQLPRLDAIEVDVPVLVFAALVAFAASMLAGLAPAVIATRTDAVLALRAGFRGTGPGVHARRMRSILVVAEVAASIVLLVGAALLARSLAALVETDLGVKTEGVMVAQLDLSLGRAVNSARQSEIAQTLQQRVAAIPTVQAAGFGTGMPPTGEFMRASFTLVNKANSGEVSHIVTQVPASPGYFSVLQIPLVRGRLFTDADSAAGSAVVILNREAARRFYGDDDPIGRALPLGKTARTVVGVVENVKYTGIASPNEGVIYLPFDQSPFRLVLLVARTTGDPAAIAGELRQVIKSYDSEINIISIQPLTTWVSNAVAQPRFRTLVLSTIAGVALLLAMVGLYSVIAYSTAQRTAEIGLRVAVGAQRSDVVRMVLWEGGRLAAIGTVAGIAGAYAASGVLSSFVYGVTTTDVASFGGAAIALLAVALLASYLPARKAARVDPMTALRVE